MRNQLGLGSLWIALLMLLPTASPAMANVDLVVQDVTWVEGPRIGGCNTLRVTVVNRGNEIANESTAARLRILPAARRARAVYDKSVFFSAFQPGATQVREFSEVELPAGTITLQVDVDADPERGGKLQESNEKNNQVSRAGIAVTDACGGGQCDIQAEFSRGQRTLPGDYPARLSLRFQNVGAEACPSMTVRLERYEGGNYACVGCMETVGPQQSLKALAPGERASLNWTDTDHPASGLFGYRPSYWGHPFPGAIDGNLFDGNPNNHRPGYPLEFTSQAK